MFIQTIAIVCNTLIAMVAAQRKLDVEYRDLKNSTSSTCVITVKNSQKLPVLFYDNPTAPDWKTVPVKVPAEHASSLITSDPNIAVFVREQEMNFEESFGYQRAFFLNLVQNGLSELAELDLMIPDQYVFFVPVGKFEEVITAGHPKGVAYFCEYTNLFRPLGAGDLKQDKNIKLQASPNFDNATVCKPDKMIAFQYCKNGTDLPDLQGTWAYGQLKHVPRTVAFSVMRVFA